MLSILFFLSAYFSVYKMWTNIKILERQAIPQKAELHSSKITKYISLVIDKPKNDEQVFPYRKAAMRWFSLAILVFYLAKASITQ